MNIIRTVLLQCTNPDCLFAFYEKANSNCVRCRCDCVETKEENLKRKDKKLEAVDLYDWSRIDSQEK